MSDAVYLKQHYITFGALAVNKQNCTHPAEEHSNWNYFSKFMSMAIHAGMLLRSGNDPNRLQ